MRLEINGTIEPTDLTGTIGQALRAWLSKISEDNPEMGEKLENMDCLATSLSIDFKFSEEGKDDWQVITTDNHEGIEELLVVKVDTDDSGNLLLATVRDNDGDSEFTDIEAVIAKGVPTEFPTIESKYPFESLKFLEAYYVYDTLFELSADVAGSSVIVQAYKLNEQSDIVGLISETAFPESEKEKLLEHYKQLQDASD